jgi:hypothetical protein
MELMKRYGPIVAGVYLALTTLLRLSGHMDALTVIEQNQESILTSLAALVAGFVYLYGVGRKLKSLWKNKQGQDN